MTFDHNTPHAAFWPSVIQQEARGERVYDLPSRLVA